MVKGFEKFVEAFAGFEDCFVVIGGTACDIILSGTDMRPRATKDIDILLVVEKMTPEFGKAFWEFIKAGEYKNGRKRTSDDTQPKYEMYRFDNPKEGYPIQIELLARHSDILGTPTDYHLEPLPYDGVSSLSAIMMDNDLYDFTIRESGITQGVRIASPLSLICLKAKAYRNLMKDKEDGKHVNSDDLKKHKNDVLKLIATRKDVVPVAISESMMETIKWYINQISLELQHPSRPLQNSLGRDTEQIIGFLEVLEDYFFIEE